MPPALPTDEVVLATNWFQIVARRPAGWADPHYSLRTLDYVGVVATDRAGRLLLVRQFRPAVWAETLELPSGHVEPGQTPEQAARAELLEETGHEAENFELLANLSPDTGRLANRMWCFFAGDATPTCDPAHRAEPGVDFVAHTGDVRALLAKSDFCSALNRAVILHAVLQGRLPL
jgi:ADP-ribose pyrophosphatase